jgi:hypothetical protein
VSPAPVSVGALGDALWLLMGGAADKQFTAGVVNLFRGLVTSPPLDPDKTVHAYAVLHESPGRRTGSRVGTFRDLTSGTAQVTCVGGDAGRCLWCVDQIVSRLSGAVFEVPQRTRKARLVEDESNASRTVLVDETVAPPRFYVPLLFQFQI